MRRVYYPGTWQEMRGYTPMVETQGGRTLWLSGHVGASGDTGWDFSPDFDAQVRQAFYNMETTLHRAGACLRDIVTMTTFIIDAEFSQRFIELRKEFFPHGDFPCSALVVAAGFAKPGMLVEIQAIAVLDDRP